MIPSPLSASTELRWGSGLGRRRLGGRPLGPRAASWVPATSRPGATPAHSRHVGSSAQVGCVHCISAKNAKTRRTSATAQAASIACRPRADTDYSGTGLTAGPLRLLRPCPTDRSAVGLNTRTSRRPSASRGCSLFIGSRRNATPLARGADPRHPRARARSARRRHLSVPIGAIRDASPSAGTLPKNSMTQKVAEGNSMQSDADTATAIQVNCSTAKPLRA